MTNSLHDRAVSADDFFAARRARMTPDERAEYDAAVATIDTEMDAEQLAYDLDLVRRAATSLVADLDAARDVLAEDRARIDLVVTTSRGWRYRVPVEDGRAASDGIERIDDAPREIMPLPPEKEWATRPLRDVPDAAE